MTDEQERKKIKEGFHRVKQKLGNKGASARAAQLALELISVKKTNMDEPYPDPIPIEINGVLDLHHFSPKDLRTLVPDYLSECAARNITEVKIIHGKGRGILRRTVHALLDKNPQVDSFRLAAEQNGSGVRPSCS